jgi:hypothetical protein
MLNARRKRVNEPGKLKSRTIPGRPPKIDSDLLIKAVPTKTDASLRKWVQPYGYSAAAVFKALKRHAITYTKSLRLLGAEWKRIRPVCGGFP